MPEQESESVREDLGYKPANPETSNRIRELMEQSQPRSGDPEAGLPAIEEAAKYGKKHIEKIREDIRNLPD